MLYCGLIFANNTKYISDVDINSSIAKIEQNINIISNKLETKNKWDYAKDIIIPVFSIIFTGLLTGSLFVFTYRQNNKNNIIDAISKSRILWLTDLRKIFADYLYELSSNKKDNEFTKYYNQIRIFLNLKEPAVQILTIKMDFANEIISHLNYKNSVIDYHLKILEIANKNQTQNISNLVTYANIDIDFVSNLSENQLLMFSKVIETMKKNDDFEEKANQSIVKEIDNQNNRIFDYENNFHQRILSINENILKIIPNTNKEYLPLMTTFDENKIGSIESYYKESLIKNIAISFNNYVKIEWESVKDEIR
jgi:hypothetical protein